MTNPIHLDQIDIRGVFKWNDRQCRAQLASIPAPGKNGGFWIVLQIKYDNALLTHVDWHVPVSDAMLIPIFAKHMAWHLNNLRNGIQLSTKNGIAMRVSVLAAEARSRVRREQLARSKEEREKKNPPREMKTARTIVRAA